MRIKLPNELFYHKAKFKQDYFVSSTLSRIVDISYIKKFVGLTDPKASSVNLQNLRNPSILSDYHLHVRQTTTSAFLLLTMQPIGYTRYEQSMIAINFFHVLIIHDY